MLNFYDEHFLIRILKNFDQRLFTKDDDSELIPIGVLNVFNLRLFEITPNIKWS